MLALDVETLPLISSLAVPFDRASASAPANYKDPAKIAEFIDKLEAECQVARVKTCSINPRLGRIVCLSYVLGDDFAEPQSLYAETEADEPELLRQFWALCLDASAEPLVTWNGSFDLRWIVVRSMIHGITPTVGVTEWMRRGNWLQHCDCKAFLLWEHGSRVAGEGLDEWSQVFGLAGKPDGVDGSKVYPMFLAGQHAEIRTYCESDVRNTLAMYRIIRTFI